MEELTKGCDMKPEDLKLVKEHFFADPSWHLVEELIRSYINPLESCLHIRADMSNDEIASEVRGRQIAYETLDKFLVDSGLLKPRITKQVNFN
jgi:hypothetical protein